MTHPSEGDLLGDYRLKELLVDAGVTRSWLAEQVSISRLVLVDELRDETQRDTFLADVRAKAAVDHPLIGSVYEAVAEPGLCFYAHELLPGLTLATREKYRRPLDSATLTPILRRVAEAQLQHEALGQAASALDLDAIHQDDHGVIRLKNLAVAGPRTPEQSVRDITCLGARLVPLVAEGKSGATRLLTLLSWMRGEGIEAPIGWTQVRDFCQEIEHQLSDSISSLTQTQAGKRSREKTSVMVVSVVTVLVLAGIVAVALQMRPSSPRIAPRASLPEPVAVDAGTYPTPDGLEQTLPAFKISANEVTLGEYAEFLQTLQILAKNQNEKIFDHAEQPADKISHQPDDWAVLLEFAKSNGLWKGEPVTLDSPVVGIDWWDAVAYAEWKKGRLPTQEEWFAALNFKVTAPAPIAPGPWLPVTSQTTDRTASGLIGMAGSVCEWTANPAPNPANPFGGKLWVLIGGSYLKPGSNALSREWIPDRSLRRPDLGFRLVFE